jgi:hypothetical protein
MTYEFAMRHVPVEAALTATFGHPGDGGYSECYRFEGHRFIVSNGPYDAVQPFTWNVVRKGHD